MLDALSALFEGEWARATELTVDTGAMIAREPRAIDGIDAEILGLLLSGLNDKAAASHLGASLRTVQRRVRRLMDLVGAETAMQLGWHAARLGWPHGESTNDDG